MSQYILNFIIIYIPASLGFIFAISSVSILGSSQKFISVLQEEWVSLFTLGFLQNKVILFVSLVAAYFLCKGEISYIKKIGIVFLSIMFGFFTIALGG